MAKSHPIQLLHAAGTPERDEDQPPVLTMRGLTPVRDRLQAQLDGLRLADPASDERGLAALGAEALEAFEHISVLCDRAGVEPHLMPDPARRAYAWFGALCDPAERESHLAALRMANAFDARVRVRFYNTAGLYRFVPRGGAIELTAQQAFVHAPPTVLSALVRLGVPYSRKRRLRASIAEHVEGLGFKARLAELERHRRPDDGAARGACVDLHDAFRRVNRDYFGSALPRPHLAWGRRVRRQEFGRYDAPGDTVWLNPILDDRHLPSYVVDFVLYHELLHKVMGIRLHAGRRQVHPSTFREAEKRYLRYAEAEAWLKRLSGVLRRT